MYKKLALVSIGGLFASAAHSEPIIEADPQEIHKKAGKWVAENVAQVNVA